MAERQFGPYRLVRQIAVGGMAEIHLAKTKGIAGFEKYVALKMIHPNFAEDEQFIQMLVDEAKIAVQLNHGNIAQTFDLGRVGDTYYITMEYVDGADLYKILRRASEQDLELPLDICAFVAKEIASALDHAHRKRDHTGRPLGIVHRDVSPQNVLISYAGEVKLVDFGIAKATMKARQTAVGVIKGKYYYMSPEQAWGESIDYRSDIFSAGIVLYEMMTGQMLYLEEDLHKLLDMARRADIASPTTLRKGIPPQLEKIVMRALQKKPADRYQSAADFASDLERFLHTYSPVFTAAKLTGLLRKVVGEPSAVPAQEDFPDIETDGPIPTMTLNPEDLIHDKDEIHDENSVIFRVADLKPKQNKMAGAPEGRVTRAADLRDSGPAKVPGKIPSVAPPKPPAPAPAPAQRAPSKPRDANQETRQVAPAPADPTNTEDSGLLELRPPRKQSDWDNDVTDGGGELENIGERTMITGGPKGFMMDVASEDGVDATIVSAGPPQRPDTDEGEDGETLTRASVPTREEEDGEDGPTVQRDFRDGPAQAQPRVAAKKTVQPPAALAAKIHAPAVSEIRKPRASRKTPGTGVPQPNVLQAIVNAQASEPMPAPPPQQHPQHAMQSQPMQQPPMQQQPMQQQPMQPAPMMPPHLQQYAQTAPPNAYPPAYQHYQNYPPGQSQPVPVYQPQQQTPPQGYQQAPVTPGALYQMQPFGAPPQPMSLTGQLRLYEADEMPSVYRVSGGPKWLKLAIAGIAAISLAAGITFLIIRSTRDAAPTTGSVHITSAPAGAEVVFDGSRLTDRTPLTVDGVPVGTRHDIRIELPRYRPYTDTADIPKAGGEVQVAAQLQPVTGKLRITTHPDGAEIYINGQLRGRAPTTLNDIDMDSAKTVELRLKDYQPYVQQLTWPANGQIDIETKLYH